MSAVKSIAAHLRPRQIARAAFASLLMLPLAHAPASAANFFEKLFGVQQAPVAAPRPSVVLPPPVMPVQRVAPNIRKEKPKARIAHVKPGETPARIARTSVRPEVLAGPLGPFLRDPTLRRGDVVVTTEGLKVFTGQGGGQHAQGDFLALAHAGRFAAGNSSVLAAIDRANRFSMKPLVEQQSVAPVRAQAPASQQQANADGQLRR